MLTHEMFVPRTLASTPKRIELASRIYVRRVLQIGIELDVSMIALVTALSYVKSFFSQMNEYDKSIHVDIVTAASYVLASKKIPSLDLDEILMAMWGMKSRARKQFIVHVQSIEPYLNCNPPYLVFGDAKMFLDGLTLELDLARSKDLTEELWFYTLGSFCVESLIFQYSPRALGFAICLCALQRVNMYDETILREWMQNNDLFDSVLTLVRRLIEGLKPEKDQEAEEAFLEWQKN